MERRYDACDSDHEACLPRLNAYCVGSNIMVTTRDAVRATVGV
jgi:hypothetical protein